MKISIIIIALATYSAYAFGASKEQPVYTQCEVELPGNGTTAGVCKDTGEKHYQFLTCEGKSLAYIAPGALPRTDKATCGITHKGYPGAKD